jgi:hypothetical protein
MEDLAWYPNSANQPHIPESFIDSDNLLTESQTSSRAMEALMQEIFSVSIIPVRSPRKRALTRDPAGLSFHEIPGAGSNQLQFLEPSIGTTGLFTTDNDGQCLESYWPMVNGPPDPQYVSGDTAIYLDTSQQSQSATMPSSHPSYKHHNFESPLAMRGEGCFLLHNHRLPISNNSAESISSEGNASSEIGGYVTPPQNSPNGDTVSDVASAFITNHARGLVFPASYALSHEEYATVGNLDVRSIVPVKHVSPPGYVSAQASNPPDIDDQTPRIHRLWSSGATHPAARRKRNKRKFTEVERATIKLKRKVGVCADCRRRKRRVRILPDC